MLQRQESGVRPEGVHSGGRRSLCALVPDLVNYDEMPQTYQAHEWTQTLANQGPLQRGAGHHQAKRRRSQHPAGRCPPDRRSPGPRRPASVPLAAGGRQHPCPASGLHRALGSIVHACPGAVVYRLPAAISGPQRLLRQHARGRPKFARWRCRPGSPGCRPPPTSGRNNCARSSRRCGNDTVEEYRVGFSTLSSPAVIYGCIWPVLSQEEAESSLSEDNHIDIPTSSPPCSRAWACSMCSACPACTLPRPATIATRPSSRTLTARCNTRNCRTKSIWTPYSCTDAGRRSPCRVVDSFGDIGVAGVWHASWPPRPGSIGYDYGWTAWSASSASSRMCALTCPLKNCTACASSTGPRRARPTPPPPRLVDRGLRVRSCPTP